MRVIADLHGGDPEDLVAIAEFQEIKEKVEEEVSTASQRKVHLADLHDSKRNSGEARSYAVMWKKYKRRVLLAMSSQAFAQLVGFSSTLFVRDADNFA